MTDICKDYKPYNINNVKDFEKYTEPKGVKISYNVWLSCLNKNMFGDIDKNVMSTTKLIYDNNQTANEINNYSMELYRSDLNYTFGKVVFLIVLIVTYVYCFKVTGIIQPLMKMFETLKATFISMSDKINKELPKLKDKIPEIKNNLKDKLMPNKEMPTNKAVTDKVPTNKMPTNKMPTNKATTNKISKNT